MARRIYEIPKSARSDADALLAEDPLGRQSITIRDASNFDLDRESVLVFIEGDESVLEDADEAFQALDAEEPDEAEDLWDALKAEEEEVAGGVGFIFGN